MNTQVRKRWPLRLLTRYFRICMEIFSSNAHLDKLHSIHVLEFYIIIFIVIVFKFEILLLERTF